VDSLCSHHTFANYPADLKKKIILIQHFKSYLDSVKFEPPTSAVPPRAGDRYWEFYIKKWKRANKAILFRLSNKVIQVVFQDSSELILSSG
jgi:polo-like kinase 1